MFVTPALVKQRQDNQESVGNLGHIAKHKEGKKEGEKRRTGAGK